VPGDELRLEAALTLVRHLDAMRTGPSSVDTVVKAIEAARTVSGSIGPVTNGSMSSFGMVGKFAAAASVAFVVILLGIHAPSGHPMPRIQNSGQARAERLRSREIDELRDRSNDTAVRRRRSRQPGHLPFKLGGTAARVAPAQHSGSRLTAAWLRSELTLPTMSCREHFENEGQLKADLLPFVAYLTASSLVQNFRVRPVSTSYVIPPSAM
jgi:hypothetical protein